jgi:putative solute:sodium symporter small subunit|tara:strand:- start:193 stop:450 length:258 start_codon:yes stop_codon:yes gene_type:complete
MKEKNPKNYWRANLIIIFSLLCIWFLASFGAGILFSDSLDKIKIGGFRLGFWFAQQGSILFFVIIIVVYCFLMNWLDKKYNVEES